MVTSLAHESTNLILVRLSDKDRISRSLGPFIWNTCSAIEVKMVSGKPELQKTHLFIFRKAR